MTLTGKVALVTGAAGGSDAVSRCGSHGTAPISRWSTSGPTVSKPSPTRSPRSAARQRHSSPT